MCEKRKYEGASLMYFVYIVKCRDETYYTGYTNNIEKRLKAHNEGKGAKYTRSRGPVELVYWESYEEKGDALSREYAIKKLTRKQKEKLIKQYL